MKDAGIAKAARAGSFDRKNVLRTVRTAWEQNRPGERVAENAPAPCARKPGSGAERKLTQDMLEEVTKQGKKWRGYFSLDDMWEFLQHKCIDKGWRTDFCRDTVWRAMNWLGWDKYKQRVEPHLTTTQKERRVEFCTRTLDKLESEGGWMSPKHTDVEKRVAHVHVDEKWYYVVSLKGAVWHLSGDGEEPDWSPTMHCKSKSQIPKIMMLCAIGTPVKRTLEQGHNNGRGCGKVGMWRVVKEVKRLQAGLGRGRCGAGTKEYYERGEKQRKDCTMDTTKFREMMRHKVYPAIILHYSGLVGKVVVQMDNASPHVGRDTVQVLNAEFAAKKRDVTQGVAVRNGVIPAVPDVIITTQSAQSPDVNLCDLAFFSASQMKVFKRRRQSNRLFEVDKLEADIKAEFKKYPVASLCAMWNTLARVMQKIVYAKGGNDYELHGDVVRPRGARVRKWDIGLYDV